METPPLSTARLELRPLSLSDVPHIQRVFPRWEIVQYLHNAVPWPFPEDGALRYVQGVALPAMAEGTAWHWSLRHHSQPETLIGLISLREGEDDNRGFWLVPEWQRQRLMSEACECVTDFWFNVLNKPLLRAPKARENIGSRRISLQSGMRLVDTRLADYVSGELESEIWEITREEWAARR